MLRFANAKINIGLDVLCKRPDGYHDLQTCMLPVSRPVDAVELIPAAESTLTIVGNTVDCPPEKNLCMRALRLVQQRHGAGRAAVYLHKTIPAGAGLGGGSSDAAAVIKAADELFDLHLTRQQMEALAGELGSDVPFFIADRPALAAGRGELLTPLDLPQLEGLRIEIVTPPIHVSTAEAYAGITPHRPEIPLAQRLKAPITAWKTTVFNAFEQSIFRKYPELRQIKDDLYAKGAIYASMSGSGSALYGIFAPESK